MCLVDSFCGVEESASYGINLLSLWVFQNLWPALYVVEVVAAVKGIMGAVFIICPRLLLSARRTTYSLNTCSVSFAFKSLHWEQLGWLYEQGPLNYV